MIDLNLSVTQLAMIWAFAGLICVIPLFRVCKKQKYFIIPLVFAAIYASFVTNLEFLGKPYYEKPEKFIYIHHTVDKEGSQNYITLWAYADEKDRLYRFPATPGTEKKLQKAQKDSQNGVPQVGEFKKRKKKGFKIPEDEGELMMYPFPYQEGVQK